MLLALANKIYNSRKVAPLARKSNAKCHSQIWEWVLQLREKKCHSNVDSNKSSVLVQREMRCCTAELFQ